MTDDIKTPEQRQQEKIGKKKGDFNIFAYPNDISSQEKGHYIIFTIFESVQKRKGTDRRKPTMIPEGVSRTARRELESRPERERRPSENRTNFNAVESTRNIIRSKDSIALFMPQNITTSYGVQTEATELPASSTLIGGDVVNDIKNFRGGSLDFAKKTANIARKVGLRNFKLAGEAVQGDRQLREDLGRTLLAKRFENIGNFLQANFRNLRNPHMEFLFKGVNQRTFSFEFTFTPRSEDEAERIREILKIFKIHSMPRIRDNVAGVFQEYPSEFDIKFISKGQENEFINKISTCQLTNLSVNYTAAGVNSMHRDFGGSTKGQSPTNIQVTMEFTELEFMSSQRMEEGF